MQSCACYLFLVRMLYTVMFDTYSTLHFVMLDFTHCLTTVLRTFMVVALRTFMVVALRTLCTHKTTYFTLKLYYTSKLGKGFL